MPKTTVLLSLVFMIAAQSAEAGLGNTLEECEELYGKPVNVDIGIPPAGTVSYYLRGEVSVMARFLGERVFTVKYSKLEGGSFTAAETTQMLKENAGGKPWGEQVVLEDMDSLSKFSAVSGAFGPFLFSDEKIAGGGRWGVMGEDREAIMAGGGRTFVFASRLPEEDAGVTQSGLTQQGFLVDFDPEGGGRWERVTLAQSDVAGKEVPLEFGNVSANQGFVSLLQTNQLFALMSEVPDKLTFQNNVLGIGNGWVSGIEFDRTQASGTRPILIFKFTGNISLADLAGSNRDSFGFDAPGDMDALKLFVERTLAKEGGGNSPSSHIKRVLQDQNWTGVLGINLKVNATDLPADLRWMAGAFEIQKIRWDHIGINSAGSMQDSSMFGLVEFEAPEESSVAGNASSDYLVRRMVALFNDSRLVEFDSKVELGTNYVASVYDKMGLLDEFEQGKARIESAGGEDLGLKYTLKGQYQSNGGMDHYIFSGIPGMKTDQLIEGLGNR